MSENDVQKVKQQNLLQLPNGDYIFYGMSRGRLEFFIGNLSDGLLEVDIPNRSYLIPGIPIWIQTTSGTLCLFSNWFWFSGQQLSPELSIEARHENRCSELNVNDFDISVSHMTMSIKPKHAH